MGNSCCSERARDLSGHLTLTSWLADDVRNTPETRVLALEDGRGSSTIAARRFAKDEVIFQERALALVYPSRDPPWLAALRAELTALSGACAWQYCMAAGCLSAEELPDGRPEGLEPLAEAARARLTQLCGAGPAADVEPSQLAALTAQHLLRPAAAAAAEARGPPLAGPGTSGPGRPDEEAAARLARQLDDLAARISRNGFQVMDLKARPPVAADALFHRISFFNHCCSGLNNATWAWNGGDGFMTVRATQEVAAGEELTISYISKPWSDLSRRARRQYLKQNFNFVCLCKACCQSVAPRRPRDVDSTESKVTLAELGSPDSKLGSLLRRWMLNDPVAGDEHLGAVCEGADADPVAQGRPCRADGQGGSGASPVSPKSTQAAAAALAASPGVPLTDEDRLERVLSRCLGEGLEVTRERAQAALQAEEGHVGKTMIRLRRPR